MTHRLVPNVRKNVLDLAPSKPSKPINELKKHFGLTNVIKLASNENPIGPSKMVQAALNMAFSQLHRYPDSSAWYLREALSKKNELSLNQILIGNGSDDLIKLISETFLNPGDEVLIPSPSFSSYTFGTKIMDGTTRGVPLTPEFEYDFEAMLAAVTSKTKLVYLCSPNNPTGTYIRKQALHSFLDRLPEDVLVVFDEAYHEYMEAEDGAQGLDFLKAGYNILVMRTFSKFYALAALRIGYMFGREEVIETIDRVRPKFNVNHVAQEAAMAALDDESHAEATRQVNRDGYQQLATGLAALGFKALPSQANFFIFDTGLDDEAVVQSLLREGVMLRSGTSLGLPGYVRMSIGTKSDNETFLTAFAKVINDRFV